MKNKILREVIGFLWGFMDDKKRIDIYNKYETIGDLAYSLPHTTQITTIGSLSMQIPLNIKL